VNQIEIIDSNDFHNIEVFNISGNNLMRVNYFKNWSHLQILNLCGNEIEIINKDDFSGLENLVELKLNNNNLTEVVSFSFQSLTKLKKLHLCLNKIEKIDTDGFIGLENLEELDLANNRLIKFNANIFESLKTLKKLDISDNRTQKISYKKELKQLKHLKFLDISKSCLLQTSGSKKSLDKSFDKFLKKFCPNAKRVIY
jgi:Leucine-rich repeat (LRR) protein